MGNFMTILPLADRDVQVVFEQFLGAANGMSIPEAITSEIHLVRT
jgi:hypothetical protein